MKRGRFIVLEGIDGSGTTTQAGRLADRLREDGREVVVTAQPSKGKIGRLLREYLDPERAVSPETMALLFAADRLDHIHTLINPALEQGNVVICDRYTMSSVAYQGLACPKDWVRTLNREAIVPDLTIFLDVPVDMARRRVHQRASTTEIFDDGGTQAEIDRNYRMAAWRNQQNMNAGLFSFDLVTIAGEHDVEVVHESIYDEVNKVL